jgi:acyl carrier protein
MTEPEALQRYGAHITDTADHVTLLRIRRNGQLGPHRQLVHRDTDPPSPSSESSTADRQAGTPARRPPVTAVSLPHWGRAPPDGGRNQPHIRRPLGHRSRNRAANAGNRNNRRLRMAVTDILSEQIRRVLSQHARLQLDITTLSDDADLFQAGLSSHASVNVMLALEDAFDLEFPESLLRRAVFQSVDQIAAAIGTLKAQPRERHDRAG